jgi:hypothetical protein
MNFDIDRTHCHPERSRSSGGAKDLSLMCSIGNTTTGSEIFFHQCAQFSFAQAVNDMWKLCKAEMKSEERLNYTTASAEFGTDF